MTRRVLVIEDDEQVMEFVRGSLEARGYEVLMARTGMLGLDLSPQADLIVLDLGLPDMRGEEVLRRLREQKNDVPVIVMTGYPKSQGYMRVEGYQILEYLEKPVDKGKLMSVVEKANGICNHVDTLSESTERIKGFVERQKSVTDSGFWRPAKGG